MGVSEVTEVWWRVRLWLWLMSGEFKCGEEMI